jgi:beta-lactamase regulating signal transducer with metallopeptidase domain
MNELITYLSGPAAGALVMTLVHTLWQGCIIAALLWALLRMISTQKESRRYAVSLGALIMLVLCGFLTFSVLRYTPSAPHQSEPVATTGQPPAQSITTTPQAANPIQHTIPVSPRISWIFYGLCLWVCGVLCMIIRLGILLADQSRLKHYCHPVTDPAIIAVFEEIKSALRVPMQIQLVVCSKISIPAVMGFFEPVLLLPASVLTGIQPDMLKAILAHELAHIRRYDYLINLFQMILESLLFFNPAVWWINRQIRLEREACCDIAGSAVVGKQTDYAQLLLNWILLSLNPAASSPQGTPAFSQDKHQTLERARRMLTPGYRPQAHLSWTKWTLVLGFSLATILGLWKTSDATVAFAAKILSPKERIAKMAKLEKSHGLPAYDPNSNGDIPEDQKVTIAGIIKTWDGKPVTKYTQLLYQCQRPRSSGSISDRLISDCNNLDGVEIYYNKFRRKLEYGSIIIAASMDGYAPGFYGPFKLEPGQKKEDIEIILGQGYRADILVQDENSNPIPNVKLSGGYLYYSNGYSYTINLVTNQQGLTAIEHAGDKHVSLNLTAEGFEDTKYENIALQKDSPLVLKMTKAQPAQGTVVSAADNQPVPNAQIRLLRYEPNGSNYGKDYGPILGTTDNNGRFVLNTLRKDASYILVIKVDGFAYKFLYDAMAGQKDMVIPLQKDLVIRGQVLGSLDKLEKRKGVLTMPYLCRFNYHQNDDCGSMEYAPITITPEGAFFEIRNPWGNKVVIGSRDNVTVDLESTIPDPVVVDLSDKLTPEGKSYHKRKVILTFETPKDMPSPTGTIRLNYLDSTISQRTYKGLLLQIKDGRAEGMIDAPGEINYTLANTIGYWFAEKTLPVDDGTEPMEVKIPTLPAGMIYGQVFEEDGRPAGNVMVSLGIVKKPALPENNNLGIDGKNSSNSAETETKYTLNPLPLGGTYCVIARRDFTYQVSKPMKLTSENSIQQVDIVFPKGVTLKGQIFTPDGKPSGQIPYTLTFTTKPNNSFGCGDKTTDDNGCFEMPGVNPDADGEYLLRINPSKDYRPIQMKLKDFSKPLRLTLEKGAVLTGRVLDQKTGWPIQGVAIRASWYSVQTYRRFFHENTMTDWETVNAESKTDANGQFRFSNMKAGREYSFYVDDCRIDNDKLVKAIGGQTEELVITATPYEWSEVKIMKPQK